MKDYYEFLLLALRNYLEQSHFRKVVLGLSGGIDSALVATLAADAIGPEMVKTVMMPYEYTSRRSIEDAQIIAENLQTEHIVIPIDKIVQEFKNALSAFTIIKQFEIPEQNLQSRCRAVILMGISNTENRLLLACGNKSEILTGYFTLYGDSCGGYAPIAPCFKRDVYALAKWRNANVPVSSMLHKLKIFPPSVMNKSPSAELKPNQKDEDSIPKYATLDEILSLYCDHKKSVEDITAKGFEKNIVLEIVNLVKNSAHKRRSLPIAPITPHKF